MIKYASIQLLHTEEFHNKLDDLGPFPLDKKTQLNINEINEIVRRFRRKSQKRMVAHVMLDQDVMAGVGNYIRSDALYIAGIDPTRAIKSLSDKELKQIIRAASRVMRYS